MWEGNNCFASHTFRLLPFYCPTLFAFVYQMVHCGCIASRHLFEHMEFGGVACISCSKRLEIHSPQPVQVIIHNSSKDASLCFFEKLDGHGHSTLGAIHHF